MKKTNPMRKRHLVRDVTVADVVIQLRQLLVDIQQLRADIEALKAGVVR